VPTLPFAQPGGQVGEFFALANNGQDFVVGPEAGAELGDVTLDGAAPFLRRRQVLRRERLRLPVGEADRASFPGRFGLDLDPGGHLLAIVALGIAWAAAAGSAGLAGGSSAIRSKSKPAQPGSGRPRGMSTVFQ
jgi:hypothetical protein